MVDEEPRLDTLLRAVAAGEEQAWNELVSMLYENLRGIAHRLMSDQAAGHTLQTTALLNEALIKVDSSRKRDWESRRHLERALAKAMRHVLIDHARARQSAKRTGGRAKVTLTDEIAEATGTRTDLLVFDEALDRLRAHDETMAEVAQLRCYGGLDHEEIANVMGISRRSSERKWRFARVWLEREISRDS